MAVIIPIRGLRYNPGAGPMNELITPPYDAIDSRIQERYYRQHPYNIIRLEYGKTYPSDTEKNNRYTRAAADFAAWQEDGILQQEKTPAIYFCQEEFTHNGQTKTRSSFICGVKLFPYEKGIILPHEETMPKHKADRLALMQACKANFSPIFGLYVDPGRIIEKPLFIECRRAPDISFAGEDNRRYSIWVVTSAGVIKQVQQLMDSQRTFIADGHHRYETALTYRDLRRKQEGYPAGEYPCDYVMMSLVNLYDPGLVILPTHRIIRNAPHLNVEEFLKHLREHFLVEKFPPGADHENLNAFFEALGKRGSSPQQQARHDVKDGRNQHPHVFGLYTGGGRLYLLTLRDKSILSPVMPSGYSLTWQGLDVSILHYLILKRLLGIGEEQWADENYLSYTREEENILAAVDAGTYQLAFFLNPILIEEFTAVAASGEKMPQKSTYFYPKIVTGLVINQL